jgi:CubicO group peptidase (beta-lactamase class C family)
MFDPVVGARLTPRDLVTHRSGLTRHDYAWYGSSASRAELVRALRHLEPTSDLRTTWQYQNLLYMTAGYLAGRLLDSSWEALVRERIIEPLGMENTSLSVGDLMSSTNDAPPHESRTGKMREVPYRPLDALGPAGSINSTVNDMTRCLRLHLVVVALRVGVLFPPTCCATCTGPTCPSGTVAKTRITVAQLRPGMDGSILSRSSGCHPFRRY